MGNASSRRTWWGLAVTVVATLSCASEREQVAHTATVVAASAVAVAAPPSPAELPVAVPEAPAKADDLELTFVGDLVLGRYTADDRYLATHPGHPGHPGHPDPFAEVRELLAADLVFGNLESPVMFERPRRSPSQARHRFAGDPAQVAQLADAGFTVLSLANNHFFDLGVAGQRESPQVLREAGITPVGASRTEAPWIRVETVEVEGWRIGFVAFTSRVGDRGDSDGPRPPLLATSRLVAELLPPIRAARADHDLLIVSAHWGVEYADEPGQTRELIARHLLGAGVDLVIGHHPHVLQGIDRHPSGGPDSGRDGLIAYSLGNFLFHRGDHPPGLTGVLRVRYARVAEAGSVPISDARPCLSEARVHPVTIVRQPHWTPVAAEAGPAAKVRDRVTSLSRALGTRWVREGEAGQPDRGEDLILTGLRACPATTAQP